MKLVTLAKLSGPSVNGRPFVFSIHDLGDSGGHVPSGEVSRFNRQSVERMLRGQHRERGLEVEVVKFKEIADYDPVSQVLDGFFRKYGGSFKGGSPNALYLTPEEAGDMSEGYFRGVTIPEETEHGRRMHAALQRGMDYGPKPV